MGEQFNFVSPSRDEPHEHAFLAGQFDYLINEVEVGFVGAERIVSMQRTGAISIRRVQSVELGEHHRLDHRETFLPAIFEVN